MLAIRIYRDKQNSIYKFEATGHCNFAARGTDIVCSAASVLLQTAVLSLMEYCKIFPAVEVNPGKLICFILPELQSFKVEAVTETMVIGLKKIEEDYPGHVKINEFKEEKR